MAMQSRLNLVPFHSAVARVEAGGARAPLLPSLFSKKVKTDLYKMLKIKYQATVWEIFKK